MNDKTVITVVVNTSQSHILHLSGQKYQAKKWENSKYEQNTFDNHLG